jgi:hypothetical protein
MKIGAVILTLVLASSAWAQQSKPLETGPALTLEQTEFIGIAGHGGEEICRFAIGTGLYTRGSGFTDMSCQDFVQVVSKHRPWSLFCWLSDACSSQAAQARQPRPAAPAPPVEE